eukprot:scaffold1135_cov105-Skeletonema_dohrnii-CCMP3373.AAC.1
MKHTSLPQRQPTTMGGRSSMTGRAGRAAKDRDDEDRLLKMLIEMNEKELNQILQCGDETSKRLLEGLDSRGIDHDGIKHMNSLRVGEEQSAKKKPPTTATDAVFSSAAANNYYHAIGYRMGNGPITSNSNDGAYFKNIKWKEGLKEEVSVEKSESTNTSKSTGSSSKSEESSGKSITSLEEILAFIMEKGKTPAIVADYLMNVGKTTTTTEVDKRRTDDKIAQKSREKLIAKALKESKTTTEAAEYVLKFEEEKKKASNNRKRNEHVVKVAMKRGGKTPAEIAANVLQADEEKKTQELVEQALKICNSPKEIADYLMKAGKDKQIKAEIKHEQESAEKLVQSTPKQGMIRSGVASYLLMKAEQEKESQARPRSSTKSKSYIPPPIKSFDCHRPDDVLSTTSSVTNHLKSSASVMSSECSIVTEIVNPTNVDYSPSAVLQNKENKSSTSLRGMKVSFSNRAKKMLQNKEGVQNTSKMATVPEAKAIVDNKDDREILLNSSQSSLHNPDDCHCCRDVELISDDSNEESQEMSLVGRGESHSAPARLCGNIEEEDKKGQKKSNWIDKAKKGNGDEESNSKPMQAKRAESDQKITNVGKDPKTNKSAVTPAPSVNSLRLSGSIEEEGKKSQKKSNWIDMAKKGNGDEESNSKSDKQAKRTESDQKISKVGKDPKRNTAPLKDTLRRILAFKKKWSPKKIVNEKAEKRSLKIIVDHKTKSSEETSDGTDTKSSASNESTISVKTEYVKNMVDESSSKLAMEGPMTSINIQSDLNIDDELSLPSILRRSSKIKIWDEPDVSAETSLHPDDETKSTQYSYSGDSMTFVDDDDEQGCDIANEVKGYGNEIVLIVEEFRDFAKAGLNRVSAMLGCDSTDLQKRKLEGNANTTPTEVKGGDDEMKAMEQKREIYMSKLRNVSLSHI